MPTYQYKCSKCDGEFEAMQSMKDKPLTKCELLVGRPKKKCGGRVQRQIGAGAGLIFKGSGFYITDYRSEGYKQAAKKDSEAAKPSSTASSDAKPAAKSESKPAKSSAKK
ncbi:MAG: zinc ribbon domain-containing protein [Verrucomicrobiota bacterium]